MPAAAPVSGEDQAFGEQLADEAAAAASDREPHADFAVTPCAARHEQVGEVGAGNQQHEHRDRHHDLKGRHVSESNPGVDAGAGRGQHDAVLRDVVLDDPFGFQQALKHRRHHGLRLLAIDARLHPRDLGGEGAAAALEVVRDAEGNQRHPRVGSRADALAGETGRRHADHEAPAAVQQERPADHAGIASELAVPERIAQHDHRAHRLAAVRKAIVVRREESAGGGPDAEQLEIVAGRCGHRHVVELDGLAAGSRDRQAKRRGGPGSRRCR